ncbi:unnamed protein product [Closterium sp. NIES-53]
MGMSLPVTVKCPCKREYSDITDTSLPNHLLRCGNATQGHGNRVFPLPSPPESSLPVLADPESYSLCAASPTITRLLSTVVTNPSFESTAASALVVQLVDFVARCRIDYATCLVAESESVCPPFVWGECALSTDVLEDRQEEFQCFAAALPHLVSTLIAPEGDPDAPDIPTPRSYAEAIEGPYSSQWQSAMDAEMASWKSTGTYVDEVPPPGANIISGMWIFRVKRPPGSPPVFKARYVAQGFSPRQGVDYFQTFSPTPKMTTLRVLLHVVAQRDYELHSLDFSTAFLQGSLHEEIWLRRPSGFTGSFPPGTQWSLRRPVYGLRQAPREWHDTLRTTLAAPGFAPSTADPSLFLRTDTSLPPFYILVYITRDRAQRTITLTQSHMVQPVLQRFDFTYSSPQATPLSTRHSLSALPSDESVEPSGPYPELVGCLMYLMTCTRPDLAYPLSILARYVGPGRHRQEHMAAAKRVLRYLCSTSGMGLVLGGRRQVVLTGHADASWADNQTTQQSSQGYTFSLGSGSVSWRSTRSSSVLGSSCEAEIYAGAMAAQELRWLTYLLTDLGEPPRSPPVLYVDNKAMLALCREHRLEHRTKRIALCYFLARELQQRGQLRLACVASQANIADIFTKALPPGDHKRFCTMLACFALLDWSCDLLFSPTLPMGEQQLPLIEFAYNNSPSATTQQSPFYLNYGQDPTVPMTLNPDNPVPRAQQFVEILQAARTRAAEAIKIANVIAKRNADRHRRPVTYQPNDLVLLDTQNLHLPITPKLRPRYCGPFRISHMITPVTAHLLLPAVWYVSPFFHVTLLRPFIPSTCQLARNRPASMTRPQTEPVITPEKIMGHRVCDPRGARRVEFLIRWRDRTPTEDSWVPLGNIENYPVLTEYLRSRNFRDIHAFS